MVRLRSLEPLKVSDKGSEVQDIFLYALQHSHLANTYIFHIRFTFLFPWFKKYKTFKPSQTTVTLDRNELVSTAITMAELCPPPKWRMLTISTLQYQAGHSITYNQLSPNKHSHLLLQYYTRLHGFSKGSPAPRLRARGPTYHRRRKTKRTHQIHLHRRVRPREGGLPICTGPWYLAPPSYPGYLGPISRARAEDQRRWWLGYHILQPRWRERYPNDNWFISRF